MGTETQCRVSVEVSADHVQAWLRLEPEIEAEDVTAEEITAALEEAKVAVNDAVQSRADEFLRLATDGEPPTEPFLVAEGTAPEEGCHGEFIWDPLFEGGSSSPDESRIDYRTVNMILTVEPGQAVGTIEPPIQPQPGIDVHGGQIPAKGRVEAVTLQGNVHLGEDGLSVIAEEAGRVIIEGRRLHIRPVLEIHGDVDFESGNVNATSDVSIRGTVLDLFQVISRKSIAIGGAVEAARVVAREDVLVRGGILSRSKGTVRAGGSIGTKMCTEADVRCNEHLEVAREAINSTLFTNGKLISPRAAIIGGRAYAREGAEVHTLGSDACVPTLIAVGIHPQIFWRLRRLEAVCRKQQETLDKIGDIVDPLRRDLQRLTYAQREQICALTRRADEISRSMKTNEAEREELLATNRPAEPASVHVQGRLCPNASVAIDGNQARFGDELKGPVRIEQREVDNAISVVAVSLTSGSITVLDSGPVDAGCVPDYQFDFQAEIEPPVKDDGPPDERDQL